MLLDYSTVWYYVLASCIDSWQRGPVFNITQQIDEAAIRCACTLDGYSTVESQRSSPQADFKRKQLLAAIVIS